MISKNESTISKNEHTVGLADLLEQGMEETEEQKMIARFHNWENINIHKNREVKGRHVKGKANYNKTMECLIENIYMGDTSLAFELCWKSFMRMYIWSDIWGKEYV